jgi:Carboxypeptidase regulatory-like domain/TonB dependent receptor
MPLRKLVLSVILLGLGFAGPLRAQRATASVSGTLTDPSGSVIPDATVQAAHVATGARQATKSDSQGRYRIAELPVGEYQVQVAKEGFQSAVHSGIVLTVGAETVVDFALPVGQATQTISVDAEVSTVNTTSAQLSTLIEQTQLRELPLNGRNIEQLVLLAPGVSNFTGIFQGPFYGGGFTYSVAGARPNGQAELLDDTDVQNYFAHGAGAGSLNTAMGVDAVGEFQILTNTYSSQFGGNGSVLNEVTKSGTNAFHGSGYGFLRNSALDARSFFDKASPAPFRRGQFGGTLGGPIKKEKMFFFVNYEGLRQALGETRIISVPDNNARLGYLPATPSGPLQCVNNTAIVFPDPACANTIPKAIQPYLSFYNHVPPPTTSIGGGIGQETLNPVQTGSENYVIGRYDWTLSSKDSLFARYLGDFAHLFEPTAGPLPNVWPSISRNRNQFATLEEKHIVSNSVINSARFAFSRPFQDSSTGVNSYPLFQYFPGKGLVDGSMAITGLTGFGTAAPGPWHFGQNKFAIGDDIYWNRGAHTLRLGGEAKRVQSNVWSPVPGDGGWTFQSLALFLQGTPFSFSGILPDANGNPQADAARGFREWDFALYMQDDWKLSPSFTLNLGVRYSPTTNPTEVSNKLTSIVNAPFGGYVAVPNVYASNPSLHNFDPRVGFAWDIFKNHRTSLRGGFGIFHNLIGPRDFAAEYYNNPPFKTGTQFNPTFPLIFSAVSPTQPTQSFGLDYYLGTTPYVEQWNFSLQHEVIKDTVVSVAYVGSHGLHQIEETDANPPVPTVLPGGQLQFSQLVNGRIVMNPFVNPAYGALQIGYSNGYSKYNSAQLSVNRRLTGNWQAQLSYTYAECTDDGSGSYLVDGGTVLANPFNAKYDEGWCAYYNRHTLTVNSTYTLPFRRSPFLRGWQVSGILTDHTGYPVNITDGFSQAYSGGGANRPNVVPGCDPAAAAGDKVKHFFNTACFTLPAVGLLGNLGRNVLIGPGFNSLDASLSKNTKIAAISDQFAIQFRAEFFNILNHANFAAPASGLFVQGANGGGNPNPTAGQITAVTNPGRQIQFGLKVLF